MSEQKKITQYDPIESKRQDSMMNEFGSLIRRHNQLCAIEKAFNESDEFLKMFNEVSDEVTRSGNASLAVIFALTIEALNAKIHDLLEDNPTATNSLEYVQRLEAENAELKKKLEDILQVIENGSDING